MYHVCTVLNPLNKLADGLITVLFCTAGDELSTRGGGAREGEGQDLPWMGRIIILITLNQLASEQILTVSF